jgi:hypothetical protein
VQAVDEIWRCGNCSKIFWMGPKSYNAIELVGGMLKRALGQEGQPSGAAGGGGELAQAAEQLQMGLA